MISKNLLSHQVFEYVQGGISDSPMRKGKILFANEYTGEPVEMDDDLRVALSHEGTFIGNNPINQLEKAMAGVPGGPWYIDVRNDILYIHNKALDQPSSYEYVYGSENGELLSVSFKTQYQTKNVPRNGSMSLDQFSKILSIYTSSQTSPSEIVGDDTDRTAKEVLIRKSRDALLSAKNNTMYPTKNRGGGISYTKSADLPNLLSFINTSLRRKGKKSIGNDINSLYEMSLDNLNSWYDSYINYLSQQTTKHLDSYQRTAAASDLRYQQKIKSDEIYQAQSYDEFERGVGKFLNDNLGERGSRYRQEAELALKLAYKQGPEAVNEVLHKYFDNTTYSQYTHTGMNMVSNIDVATLLRGDMTISPAVNGNGNIFFTKSDGRFKQSGEEIGTGTIMSGVIKYFKSLGYRNISLTAYDARKDSSRSVSCKLKISYRQPMKNYKTMSGYQFMYDYYTRYNGSPHSKVTQLLRGQALGANRSRKITEKRLQIEMVVVGRPSLTTNSKLKISNIGSRSGDYIIERCIHQITPEEGYTCSLTLSQGSHNEPVGSLTDSIPITSEPKKSGGGTPASPKIRSRDDGVGGKINTSPTEPVEVYMTPQERTYFKTLITREDAVDAQEEFVYQIKYSRVKAYEDARKAGKSRAEAKKAVKEMNQKGIISNKKHTSSDNSVLNNKLKPNYQEVPTRYRVAYRDEVRGILQESVGKIKSKIK